MSEYPSETTGGDEGEDDAFDLGGGCVTQPERKKRKLRSKVWNDFTRIEGRVPSEDTAVCKHCKKLFVADSAKGISHLKKHALNTCPVKNASRSVSKGPCDMTPKVEMGRLRKTFDEG
ncbi:hypothetical protein Vadar_004806 [Vaccinium darrowii]|uniref:Uncharacterized protein n=1 Tax=Vaccinium darrowii TaxID=229202 RepID=A0ACB7Y4W8_9ERIC|nr:hypothetical protein Vadar_004806 [Vaccinium darrowii]